MFDKYSIYTSLPKSYIEFIEIYILLSTKKIFINSKKSQLNINKFDIPV